MLTVGTLSVPKDTQGPAGLPPASSLPRQCSSFWGHQRLPRTDHVCKGRLKPQLSAQRLLKTYDINKCDLSFQEVPDTVLGAGDIVDDDKIDVATALLKHMI